MEAITRGMKWPVTSIEWSYTSTPLYVFIVWCLIKHRDVFSFVGFELLTAVTVKSAMWVYFKPTFRRNVSPPSSG
jgi:hypothetical protein